MHYEHGHHGRHLSKYIIGHQVKEPYQTPATLYRKHGDRQTAYPFLLHQPILSGTEEFWALKDLSFEVQQGDRSVS
jgi:ABC-type polysaccharide/polyol phosphate transport system ATPase subunit